MPADISAEVIANTRLSGDYNVLALAAPRNCRGRSARAVRDGEGGDESRPAAPTPVLRVRSAARPRRHARSGISLLNKRIGVSTGLIYAARQGDSGRVPRPARPSLLARRSADRSLDGRRRRRARAVCRAGRSARRPRRRRRRCFTARGDPRSSSTSTCSATLGVALVLTTEDGSAGERGRIVAPLERRLGGQRTACAGHDLRVRTGRHARRDGENRRCDSADRARCRSSASWAAAWAAATAASCRCATNTACAITCDRASRAGARRRSDRLGLRPNGSLRPHRIADAQEPAHCGQRLLWLRRRVRRSGRSLDARRRRRQGPVSRRTRRPSRRRESSKRRPAC